MNKCSEYLFLESQYRKLEQALLNGLLMSKTENLIHDARIIKTKMMAMKKSILEEIEQEDGVKFKFLK